MYEPDERRTSPAYEPDVRRTAYDVRRTRPTNEVRRTTILVILSATDSMGRQTRFEGEFYALLVFTALGLMLMAASTDLILLALSIEYVSLTSYVLAGFLKGNPKSNEAGIKYFLFGATASAVMFYGFSLVYGLTGML